MGPMTENGKKRKKRGFLSIIDALKSQTWAKDTGALRDNKICSELEELHGQL